MFCIQNHPETSLKVSSLLRNKQLNSSLLFRGGGEDEDGTICNKAIVAKSNCPFHLNNSDFFFVEICPIYQIKFIADN